MDEEIEARELDMLAAEAALGLLSEAELAAVEVLAQEDEAFRAICVRWITRFARLFDDVSPQRPAAAVSDRIKANLLGSSEAMEDRFVTVVLNEEADEVALEEGPGFGDTAVVIGQGRADMAPPRRSRLRAYLDSAIWVAVGVLAAACVLWVVDLLATA